MPGACVLLGAGRPMTRPCDSGLQDLGRHGGTQEGALGMAGFRDPTRTTRAATVLLYMYMVLDPLASVLRFAAPPPEEAVGDAVGQAAIWTTFGAFFVVIG